MLEEVAEPVVDVREDGHIVRVEVFVKSKCHARCIVYSSGSLRLQSIIHCAVSSWNSFTVDFALESRLYPTDVKSYKIFDNFAVTLTCCILNVVEVLKTLVEMVAFHHI